MTDKVSLEVLTDTLLEESSRKFEESVGLKWEWEHYLKLHELVVKIQEKERNRDKGDEPAEINNKLDKDAAEKMRREQSFPAFQQWLDKQGVSMDNVEVEFTGMSGFGLKTKKDLKAGETVFTVPENIILTSYKAKSSDSSLKLMYEKDPILRSMQNVAIALFLVHEKYGNKDSMWLPYLNTFPAFYDTILYFTKDEMSLLKNSPAAFRESLKMYRNVTRQYAYFHQKFKKANDAISRVFRRILTFNRYVWAVSSVTTRINYLPNPDGEEIMSLIPLWDMCNHEEELGQVSTDFDDNTRTLTCFAARNFSKGSEFKIYYGHRNSVEYLVHNGFVPRGYRDDTYYLELGIGVNDACYVRKKALLGHVGLMCHNIFPAKPDRLQSSKGLFLFVRVFLADKDTVESMEMNSDDLGYLNEPTEQSLKFLSTRFMLLKRSVEKSKSSVLSAMDDLEQKLCTKRASMILQVLSNEQTVLEMLISSANNLLNRIQS